jgi:hypothetical protein
MQGLQKRFGPCRAAFAPVPQGAGVNEQVGGAGLWAWCLQHQGFGFGQPLQAGFDGAFAEFVERQHEQAQGALGRRSRPGVNHRLGQARCRGAIGDQQGQGALAGRAGGTQVGAHAETQSADQAALYRIIGTRSCLLKNTVRGTSRALPAP